MRRFLPWALLGLLTVGVAAGAAVGQVQSPGVTPAQWVDNVFAATAASGSAHLRFTSLTTTPDTVPLHTSIGGTGVVDFVTGSYQLTQRIGETVVPSVIGHTSPPRSQTFEIRMIAIGQNVYTEFGYPSPLRLPSTGWSKSRLPRNVNEGLGLGGDGGGALALSGLFTDVTSVRVLGPGNVDGVAATRYSVTSAPLYVCDGHRTLSVQRVGPTTVWVDAQGRLLQARSLQSFGGGATSSGPVKPKRSSNGISSVAGIAPGAETTSTSLTLSDFGAPVSVTAPPLSRDHGSSVSIALQSKATDKPCDG